jgi:lysylphosphatidylglycerol synthetase-like protein (DUF2156 family)
VAVVLCLDSAGGTKPWLSIRPGPLAEISAVVLGITAIWGGVQSRSREGDSHTARWAIALGALAVTLVTAGNVVGLALLS